MIFWFIVAGMTLGVVLLLVHPFFSSRIGSAEARAAHDVEVYRAQLEELEADVERGTLSEAEAGSARAEIGRRLLKANAAAGGRGDDEFAAPVGRKSILAGIAVVVLVPAISLAAYRHFGAQGLPDLPLSARAQPAPSGGVGEDGGIGMLIAGAEERLRAEPEDGEGWAVVAPIYLRMGRTEDAIQAFRNANRLLGPNPVRDSGLGEALTQSAGGEVTEEARGLFERALQARPDYLPARFFVALDLSQEGENADAAAAWEALIEKSQPDAPWMPIAQSALADARQKAGLPALAEGTQPGEGAQAQTQAQAETEAPAPAQAAAGGSPVARPEAQATAGEPGPGPGPEEIAAASQMNAGERVAMIEGMVSRLAERLDTDPNDAQGWLRLIRSYSVLGEDEKAQGALDRALGVFSKDDTARQEISNLGRSLGLEAREGGTPQ
ncbi:c-type cytochrome biogenesis protein CcmI [Fulvimarina endophytica]|uniref:C-type cytochrome biogenesis protein CcmI n=1 Tax=Fulvimarina endophytica TaxID=2293836 RepID=A0A371X4R8_9HYPH|nr:c-type cytochrome biogenesis protein CcmI [Fulvimarina endophytica]RFC64236.1 c-type cytochrome biogenesis protein CcmI [Fulvimarina endophytica]